MAHVRFYRMHRSLAEVALDIGDARIRLFRREQVLVCSLLRDLPEQFQETQPPVQDGPRSSPVPRASCGRGPRRVRLGACAAAC